MDYEEITGIKLDNLTPHQLLMLQNQLNQEFDKRKEPVTREWWHGAVSSDMYAS